MTTDELRELYGKQVSITHCEEDFFDDDYVLWLEKKLLDIEGARADVGGHIVTVSNFDQYL